jgi:hypothetical protein
VEYTHARLGIFQLKIWQRMFRLNPTKDVLLLARGKNGKIAPIECRIPDQKTCPVALQNLGGILSAGEEQLLRRVNYSILIFTMKLKSVTE